jgi:hypothetical protein
MKTKEFIEHVKKDGMLAPFLLMILGLMGMIFLAIKAAFEGHAKPIIIGTIIGLVLVYFFKKILELQEMKLKLKLKHEYREKRNK